MADRGRPGLKEAEAARVKAALRRLRDERHGGVNARVGRALKMSGSAVSYILGGTNRASYETALKVADALSLRPGDLLDYSTQATDADLSPDPDFPSRAQALAAARVAGIRPDAIEAVGGMRFKGKEGKDPPDPGVEYWLGEVLHVSKQMDLEDEG